MRSGNVRKEHPSPQKGKKCRSGNDVGNVTSHSPSAPEKWIHPPSPIVITAAPPPLAADPSSSATLKSQLSVAHTPYPCSSKLRESSLLAYFTKKRKLELLANSGEIEPAPGRGVPMEPAATDVLPIACGYLRTAALVHRPALPTFPQLASQDEVSYSPSHEGQPAALLSKHKLSPIIISSDHSFNVGEWVSSLAASPAVFHRQEGLAASCHDSPQDHSIPPPSSPPAALCTRSSTSSIHPMLPTRSSSGAASSPQTEFIKGELNDQSLLDLSCLQSDSMGGADRESKPFQALIKTLDLIGWQVPTAVFEALSRQVCPLREKRDKSKVRAACAPIKPSNEEPHHSPPKSP
ncbi:hypothetical protein NDU88_000893 [Pleurodeles waltl]|uniref:Uncharacterized protein n=1 Tax=Pleurodeles waltl TaxID=8319 RepID=A0AAV7KR63_PLEWA|nr:hypothetical protein NDU88_000893 [Pleurodeles waltl]